ALVLEQETANVTRPRGIAVEGTADARVVAPGGFAAVASAVPVPAPSAAEVPAMAATKPSATRPRVPTETANRRISRMKLPPRRPAAPTAKRTCRQDGGRCRQAQGGRKD